MSTDKTPEAVYSYEEAFEIAKRQGESVDVRGLDGMIRTLHPDGGENIAHQAVTPDLILCRHKRRQGWVESKEDT